MCCSPWGRKELDMTEQLNRTELNKGLRARNSKSWRQLPLESLERALRGSRSSRLSTWSLSVDPESRL